MVTKRITLILYLAAIMLMELVLKQVKLQLMLELTKINSTLLIIMN